MIVLFSQINNVYLASVFIFFAYLKKYFIVLR